MYLRTSKTRRWRALFQWRPLWRHVLTIWTWLLLFHRTTNFSLTKLENGDTAHFCRLDASILQKVRRFFQFVHRHRFDNLNDKVLRVDAHLMPPISQGLFFDRLDFFWWFGIDWGQIESLFLKPSWGHCHPFPWRNLRLLGQRPVWNNWFRTFSRLSMSHFHLHLAWNSPSLQQVCY